MNWNKTQYVTDKDGKSIVKTTGEHYDNGFTGTTVYSIYPHLVGYTSKTFNKRLFTMSVKSIQYLKTADGYSFYKINHELKRITRICANRRTFPDYTELQGICEDTVKARKQEWHSVENSFFSNNEFEWFYDGKKFKTVNTPSCDEKFLQENDEKMASSVYKFLAWHNGFVWATYLSGNSYPKVHLTRIDNRGKKCDKWTDIKYLKNFTEVN